MPLIKLFAASVFVAAIGTFLWRVLAFFLKPQYSFLRRLPGPKQESLVWGNLKLTWKRDQLRQYEEWEEQYGNVFVYKVYFNIDRLYISDLRAVNHVLTHSYVFQKPENGRVKLANIMGDGVLVAEGELHKKQRRILNPCFGPSSIRDLTPLFFEKAIKLQGIWESEIADPTTPKRLDVLVWLSRATLDIIGKAGFNYDPGSLNVNEVPDELTLTLRQLYHTEEMISSMRVVRALMAFARIVPFSFSRIEHAAKQRMLRIGTELLRQCKEAELAYGHRHKENGLNHHDTEGKEWEDNGSVDQAKDLLSVLYRANQDVDLPESQRMSEDEAIAQFPTFLVAGHETASTQATWALFSLASNPPTQHRLRAEALSCPTSTPTMDDLNALPYLDAVVRESLRLNPAIPGTTRIAMTDEEIPVGEGYVDRDGVRRFSVVLKAGEGLHIPITAINRSKAIWGEDAKVFNPERWANVPQAASAIPGVTSNLLSFLGGARSCIGYRFAMIEIKVLLFTLIRNFEFALALPADEIEDSSLVVTRPYVKSEPRLGAQMPLFVKRYCS